MLSAVVIVVPVFLGENVNCEHNATTSRREVYSRCVQETSYGLRYLFSELMLELVL